MKTWIVLFIAVFATESFAVGGRCSVDNGIDVAKAYSEVVTAQLRSMLSEEPKLMKNRNLLEKVLEEVPAFLLFNNESTYNVTHPSKSDIFLEGFFRAKLKRKDFMLIPPLGIGLDLRESDILYFCIEYTPEEVNRRVTLLTLSPNLNRNDQVIEVKRRPISITLNPISTAKGIIDQTIGQLPGTDRGVLTKGLLQIPAAFVDLAWMGVRRYTIHPRVFRVELRPNEIDISYQVRVLRILKLVDKRKRIKREVPLLKNEVFEEESEEFTVDIPKP